jgi:hypothetical protein
MYYLEKIQSLKAKCLFAKSVRVVRTMGKTSPRPPLQDIKGHIIKIDLPAQLAHLDELSSRPKVSTSKSPQ